MKKQKEGKEAMVYMTVMCRCGKMSCSKVGKQYECNKCNRTYIDGREIRGKE